MAVGEGRVAGMVVVGVAGVAVADGAAVCVAGGAVGGNNVAMGVSAVVVLVVGAQATAGRSKSSHRSGFDCRLWCLLDTAYSWLNLALASRLRLTPDSAASIASRRCTSGGMRTMNLPL